MFERGITDRGLLDALRGDPAWHEIWDKIVRDDDLFPAVRKNAVHVYHRGCRLFGFSQSGGKLRVQTHYKYLIDPRVRSPYVDWSASGELTLEDSKYRSYFVKRADDLEALKTAASAYAGHEKVGVHALVRANRSNILDVEIALTGDASRDDDSATGEAARRRVADRIDFAALQEVGGEIQLAFFEAKHFDNGELRARGSDTDPPVVEQMVRYEGLVAAQADDIKKSYRLVCENLRDLQHDCPKVIRKIADGEVEFSIAPRVRLVVFGFDAAQRDGGWAAHQKKLEDIRGKNLVICVGNPAGYRRGISDVERLV